MDTTTTNRLKCSKVKAPLTFFEFLAGGRMARLGLASAWQCTFANEWCEKNPASYRVYFGSAELKA
jgi:DNA (cytosine-5)-methyltransferase 1